MTLPKPEAGLVIRYAYLWTHERNEGADEGRKDRPCAVVVAQQTFDGETVVTVLPITHRQPDDPADGVEIPASLKSHLNLDDERSWIIVTEINSFLWPGPDLRPIPGTEPPAFGYGFLPKRFYDHVIRTFRAALDRRRVRIVKRND